MGSPDHDQTGNLVAIILADNTGYFVWMAEAGKRLAERIAYAHDRKLHIIAYIRGYGPDVGNHAQELVKRLNNASPQERVRIVCDEI